MDLNIWHWVIVMTLLSSSVLWVIPMWRILGRAGFAGAWALLGFVPGVNLAMLWTFAFIRWPVDDVKR